MTGNPPGAASEPTGVPFAGLASLRVRVLITLVAIGGLVVAGLVAGGVFSGRDDRPLSAVPTATAGSRATAVPTPPEASAPDLQATYSPTSPSSPGLIAVVDDSGALSTTDDGGGSRASYPMPGVAFGFPAWSPDGSRIAVTGQGASETAIYVFTVGTDGPPTIVYRSLDRTPFYLYWTRDGRSISFLATEPASISLRVVPADGGGPLDGSGPGSIIRTGAPLYFDWIEADRLLVHVGLGTDAFTGEVGRDGVLVSTSLRGTGNFRSASVSEDGRYLAYVRAETGLTGQLVISARDGSGTHELSVNGPAAFVFAPTGHSLGFIAAGAPVDGTRGLPVGPLKIVDSETGISRVLLDGPNVAFFWSPDGRTIATMQPDSPGDPVADGQGVVLVDAVQAATAPGAAARLIFLDVATGKVRSERVVHLADHFVTAFLPYFDQYALSHRLWSADSASLLLPLVSVSGQDQLVVVPSDGAEPRPIADGDKGFWSP